MISSVATVGNWMSANDEPRQEQLRSNSDTPRWKKSITETEELKRGMLLNASDWPNRIESTTDNEEHKRAALLKATATSQTDRIQD